MGDIGPQPEPANAGSQAIPTQAASQVALAMNLNEIALVFGHLRQFVDPATGSPGAQAAIEWIVSFSLPLPAAKNLAAGLELTIDEYEKRFGKIPSDPNQKPQIST